MAKIKTLFFSFLLALPFASARAGVYSGDSRIQDVRITSATLTAPNFTPYPGASGVLDIRVLGYQLIPSSSVAYTNFPNIFITTQTFSAIAFTGNTPLIRQSTTTIQYEVLPPAISTANITFSMNDYVSNGSKTVTKFMMVGSDYFNDHMGLGVIPYLDAYGCDSAGNNCNRAGIMGQPSLFIYDRTFQVDGFVAWIPYNFGSAGNGQESATMNWITPSHELQLTVNDNSGSAHEPFEIDVSSLIINGNHAFNHTARVGININNPAYPLDVNGSARVSNILFIGNSFSADGSLIHSDGTGELTVGELISDGGAVSTNGSGSLTLTSGNLNVASGNFSTAETSGINKLTVNSTGVTASGDFIVADVNGFNYVTSGQDVTIDPICMGDLSIHQTGARMCISPPVGSITIQSASAGVTFDSSSKVIANGGLSMGSNITMNANNIVSDTTTGVKIATSTAQKLGFFNATPVAQQSGSVTTALSNLGLVTSPTLPIAEQTISYQPGLLSAVNATKGVYGKFPNASTVDNIECSAITFSCVANPTITLYECGTSASCAGSPTTIGTCTVTASGQAFDGTVSSSSIGATHYVAWAMTAGTCASVDLAATAQVHTN